MAQLALLPLDNRPCNLEWPKALLQMASETLAILSPDPTSLRTALDESGGVVISVDRFIYGGLVESRRSDLSSEDALERLHSLFMLLSEAPPSTRVILTSVILRLSLTVGQDVSEHTWRDLFEFSAHGDAQAKARIPVDVLDRYLRVRARNHAVQTALIEGLQQLTHPIHLWFGQEDCAPEGLQVKEQRALRDACLKVPASSGHKMRFMTGADELGSLALARLYGELSGVAPHSISLQVDCPEPDALKTTALYEDISIGDNWRAHLEAINLFDVSLVDPFPVDMTRNSSPSETENRVLLIGPSAGAVSQSDLVFEAAKTVSLSHLTQEAIVSSPPGTAVLDLTCANGAHPHLVEVLLSHQGPMEWGPISAWNTAGNRIGSLLAHLLVRTVARSLGTFNAASDALLRSNGWIEYYLYSAQIRPHLQDLARERGWDPWLLKSEERKEAEALAQDLIAARAERMGIPLPGRVVLPWSRLFEMGWE